jgi:SAM-dependent methyltransferase
MKLAAAILADSPLTLTCADAELIRFALAFDPEALDERTLLAACFASPGRYVGEMLRRLRAAFPSVARYFVVNPYFAPHPSILAALVEEAGRDAEWTSVLSDLHGRPLGYAFAAAAVDDLPPLHLGLLSAQNAALDARFLRASVGECQLRRVWLPATLATPGANGFHPLSPALDHPTRRAAEMLESLPNDLERRRMVASGPRAAVVGYHAGDVLFALQALDLEPTRVDAMVVLEPFADIVRYLRPDLTCLSVAKPMPYRGDYHPTDEHALLWSYVSDVEERGAGGARFWHFLRSFRDYRRARHHLRESFAFALGGRGHALRPPAPSRARDDQARMHPVRGRVVVHFEGGWSLKEFPPASRAELLRRLVDEGFAPVLLGRPEPSVPSVAAVPYSDLAAYRLLLASSEALIGCDSFPAHFAQALDLPTVQLFGSTRPSNSRGAESPRYRLLQQPLPCVPCDELTACALDRGPICHAHATIDDVLAALRQLLPSDRAALPPRSDDELAALGRQAASVPFPSRAPMPPTAQERFLDELFARVQLERVERCPLCGANSSAPVGERFRLPVVSCPSCGLWFVAERIRAQDLPVLYSETYWTEFMRLHGYPAHVERYPFDYMAAAERVADLLPLVPTHGAVLDIGCALGALPRRWCEAGRHGVGLELDAELARKAAFYSGVRVHTSLDAVAADEPKLDAVVMYDVFEHLYDPVAYLTALRPIMADGGILYLETFRTDSAAFAREGLRHEDVKPIEHPFMYRQDHIETLLRRAGLEPFRVTYPLGEAHARVRIAARWGFVLGGAER